MTLSWSKVALRPKWIGAFFIAMTVAVVCALLAGWQGERSFEQAVSENQLTVAKPIDQVLTPGKTATQGAVGSLVKVELMPDFQNTVIISGRVQKNGDSGYWLVGRALTEQGNQIALTLGFTKDLEIAKKVQADLKSVVQIQAFMPFVGLLMPSEGAKPAVDGKYFESLSLGQLVNLWPAANTYPLFLLGVEPAVVAADLQAVSITPPSTEVQVNWLSAFYAIEWSLFCGFAFFLWWRLVRDAQLLEIAEAQKGKL